MTKEELIMLIQQEWRCDDGRPDEQKRIETEKLINECLDKWLASKNCIKPLVSGSLHFQRPIYNFRCSKCWTRYNDAKAGCPKCNDR